MGIKTESLLIRLSKELAERVDYWSLQTGEKKSSLIRKAIRHYFDYLNRDDPEVREVIRAIIISKLDKIKKEYDDGRIITFKKIIPINTALNCSLCRDENNKEYLVYGIIQKVNESRFEAIDRHTDILYNEWRLLPEDKQKLFMSDLHLSHVYFSINPLTD